MPSTPISASFFMFVPGKRAVHILLRVCLELSLSELAHRFYHPPLLSGELEVHCLSLT